jgi:hypothetical protein
VEAVAPRAARGERHVVLERRRARARRVSWERRGACVRGVGHAWTQQTLHVHKLYM